LAEKTALNPNEELFKLISHRERTILQLIANGNTDKEIARDLNISIHTAKPTARKSSINWTEKQPYLNKVCFQERSGLNHLLFKNTTLGVLIIK